MSIVYSTIGRGLGDCWMSVNWAHATGNRLASWYINKQGDRREVGKILSEIIRVLGARVEVVDAPSIKPKWQEVCRTPYLAIQPLSKIDIDIAYQFDGKNKPGITNPPPEHVAQFEAMNPEAVKLGLPLTLSQCAALLRRSREYVGVDSGYAHVACSIVGLPVTIARYRRTIRDVNETYSGKRYRIIESLAEFKHGS